MRSVTTFVLLAGALLAACSREASPPPSAAPSGEAESVPSPEPHAEDVSEAAYLARFPHLASREGPVLTLQLADGRRLRFEDRPEPGEGWEQTEFLGPLQGSPWLLLRRGFLEAGHYLLVNVDNGEQVPLDSPPRLSPDHQWLLTSSIDLVAGFFPNRLAIHRLTDTAAPLVFEIDGYAEGWGPDEARWIDARTVAYTRLSLHWQDDGSQRFERSAHTIRLIEASWVHD